LNQQFVVERVKQVLRIFPVEKIQVFNEDISFLIKADILVDCLCFLKNHCFYQLKILQCISGVDYPFQKYRFKLIYELLSIRYNFRLRLKTFVDEVSGVFSAASVFLSSGWYECEIWDMFGVFFMSHDFLRRLLTDYGFEGYPLRKDFPLTGFVEARFNSLLQQVSNEPLELYQEYRNFDFLSNWQLKIF